MARELGPARPLGEVSDAEAVAWFQTAHGASMPASWNRERLTVRSAARWWREQGWRAPSFEALRRRVKQDRTRALPRNEIERVLALDAPLREKTLWRLLYESAARAEEVLALDVEDLDLANRRARAVSKGGDVEWIMLQTGTARLLPEEFGEFLAACRPFYRDHFLTQAGTGLRPGELLGLRRRRVHPERRRIEVLEVRYEAGKFDRGFKDRPKSPASIRVVPMAEAVRGAIVRPLLPGSDPEDLVFTGPGGNRWARRGARPPLSTHNYHRVYKAVIVSRVNTPDGTVIERPRFPHLDLHGPHDLRHTFATWLEDAGIPSQVIDELMGHVGGRMERGVSPMGTLYRETTREMLARATAAIDDRLAVALKVAARLLPEVEERRRSRRARKDV